MIKTITFLQSEVDWRKAPPPSLPEYAFIGRSNVGKSSLINMLANNKSIAKTSSKPGKTQTINHFLVNNAWYLVDLPGYGYAKISKTMREKWVKMIHDYLVLRQNLQTIFVLIDARLEPQKIDLEFINSLGEKQVPFALIFTKADKLSSSHVSKNVETFKQAMLETWEELPPVFVSSAVTAQGRTEILDFITAISSEAR
ncbi:MAG: ribosome biogenesis GTP-binding protein YihA/YsxC [Bacteroidetes bacterium]|nr:ribosome biogenesis GTP-binding protein YihA/YsxC [Bacteroidota bacterium]MCL2301800.1 ribosome biogenesis GTP-binding protein YihA/YsxC [Lentimicrobiaceae bacterium]